MGGERLRHRIEGGRPASKWRDAGGDHNALSLDRFAIGNDQSESCGGWLDSLNAAGVEVWNNLALKPAAILNKVLEGDGPRQAETTIFLVFIQRQGVMRIRDV